MKQKLKTSLLNIITSLILIVSTTGCKIDSQTWFRLIPCSGINEITYVPFTGSLWGGDRRENKLYKLDRSAISTLRQSCLALYSDKFVMSVALPEKRSFAEFCWSNKRINIMAGNDELKRFQPMSYDINASVWNENPTASSTNYCTSSENQSYVSDTYYVNVYEDGIIKKHTNPGLGELKSSYYREDFLVLIDTSNLLWTQRLNQEPEQILPSFHAVHIDYVDDNSIWFEGYTGDTISAATSVPGLPFAFQSYDGYFLYRYDLENSEPSQILPLTVETGPLQTIYQSNDVYLIVADELLWTYRNGTLTKMSLPLGVKYIWSHTFDPVTMTLYISTEDGIYSRSFSGE